MPSADDLLGLAKKPPKAPSVTADQALKARERAEAEPPSFPERAGRFLVETGVKSALPMAGQLAGGFLGGMVTSPTLAGVPAGVVAGEAVGGAAGETLNQLLGITERSNAQIGLAAAGGPAGRAIGGAMRWLPGASAAAQDVGVQTARKLPALLRPRQSVDDLYAVVESYNPAIKLPNLLATSDKLLKGESVIAEVAPALTSPAIKGVAQSIKSATADKTTTETVIGPHLEEIVRTVSTGEGGQASFQAVRGALRRLGDRIDALRRTGGEELGSARLLYKSLQQDLEAAAASDAVSANARAALKAANAAARKDFAAGELEEAIEKVGITTVKSGDNLIERVNPAGLANWLRRPGSEEFKKSLTAEELKQIDGTLKMLARIPTPPPPTGANVGSALTVGRGGLGAAAGSLLGLDPVVTGGLAAWAPQLIARALVTEPGRAAIRKMVLERGALDHQALAGIAAVVRSTTADGGVTLPKEPVK